MNHRRDARSSAGLWFAVIALVFLLTPIELAQRANTTSVLALPFGWKIGVTTRAEVLAAGLLKDETYTNKPGESMFSLEQRLLAYVSEVTNALTAVKIYDMPKAWRDAGVIPGMPRSSYLARLKGFGADCTERRSEFGRDVNCVRAGLLYWAYFPLKHMAGGFEPLVDPDTLQFIVVTPAPVRY